MNMRTYIFMAFVSCTSLASEAQTKDSLEVMKTAQTFLKAFTGFDWQTFRNSFPADASIFYPDGQERKRRTGQQEIEATWLTIFPEFTDSTKKFKLEINPENILIQLYDKTAIVTFHMGGNDGYLSRRTLVFIKEKETWKIVHLHASNFTGDKDK